MKQSLIVCKINISMVLYDGAGIGKNLTQEERKYVMQNDYDGNDIGMDMLKFNKENPYIHYNLACAYIKPADIKNAKSTIYGR